MLARAFGVLFCWAATASIAQQPPAPRFRAGVEVVTVDVLVTSGGRPVTGLRSTDFELFDNGVRQRVDAVSVETVPVNAILLLDLSESVSGGRLDSLIRACRAVLGALRSGNRAAIATFSHEIVERVPLSDEKGRFLEELKELSAGGSTSLYDAAYVGLRLGESQQAARALLVVLSDGSDSSSWLSPNDVLESAARSETVAYAVVPEPLVSERPVDALMRDPLRGRLRRRVPKDEPTINTFLKQFADVTGGRLLQTKEHDLPEKFVEIVQEFQDRYLLTFSPQVPSSRGWHEITVRVNRRGAKVLARRGYWR